MNKTKSRKASVPKRKYAPTAAQARALRTRKTSFGIVYFRSKAIKTVKNKNGDRVAARSPGKLEVPSARRFGSEKEANRHARRFVKIEGHKGYKIKQVNKRPNAWVNLKTGRTNPLIGRKRTHR